MDNQIDQAIRKLETSNRGIQMIIETIDENLEEIRKDKRLAGLADDLENLFYAYLKTWLKNNKEVLNILKDK